MKKIVTIPVTYQCNTSALNMQAIPNLTGHYFIDALLHKMGGVVWQVMIVRAVKENERGGWVGDELRFAVMY